MCMCIVITARVLHSARCLAVVLPCGSPYLQTHFVLVLEALTFRTKKPSETQANIFPIISVNS